MQNSNANPESLHDVGKGTSQVAQPAFVNPNTPSTPLVKFSDTTNPEVSTSATEKLRTSLVKDR